MSVDAYNTTDGEREDIMAPNNNDDYQPHQKTAIYSMVRSFFLSFIAIGASILGWVILDATHIYLHQLAWIVGGLCIGLSFVSIMVYFILVFKL